MRSVRIVRSRIQGSGVIARKTIRSGSVVFRFSRRIERIDHPPGCHCGVCKRCIQISRYGWLYPRPGSYGWNLNHSCEPTCGIRGRDVVAMRDVLPGEEITIDYSTTNTDSAWSMRCRCGNASCRGIIRSVQSLPRRLFRKYRGWMPPYVQKFWPG